MNSSITKPVCVFQLWHSALACLNNDDYLNSIGWFPHCVLCEVTYAILCFILTYFWFKKKTAKNTIQANAINWNIIKRLSSKYWHNANTRRADFGEHPFVLDSKLHAQYTCYYILFWRNSPQWAMASSFMRFLDHTQRPTTVGRTPPDEWSARRRDLYLTTHNTHNRHPCHQGDSNPQSQQVSVRRPTP